MDRRVKERLVGASILAVLLVLIVPELLSGPAPAPVRPRLPATAPEPVRNVTVDLSTSKPQAQDPADAAETAAPTAQPPDVHGPGAANAAAADADASTGPDTDIASNAVPPPGTAHEGIARESTGRQETGRHGTAREGMSPAGAPPAAVLPRAVSNAPLEAAPPASAPSATAPKSALSGHAWAVQLGSFASRANAEKLVRQLKAQGFSVYLVSGGSGHSLRYRVRVGPMADRGAATQAIAKLKSLGQGGSLVPPAH
jgi:DedD protein